VNYDIVDPFVQYDNYPEPKYLQITADFKNELEDHEAQSLKEQDQDEESS
jgi:hypothetical protein